MISQLFADTRRFALRASIVVGAFALCAGLATAATTISTNIQTDGMLSVTSTSTFTGNIKAGDTVVTSNPICADVSKRDCKIGCYSGESSRLWW
jgi:hypothetical protein